jgi:hypothetical protein
MTAFLNQPPQWAVEQAKNELSTEVDEPTWQQVSERAWSIVQAKQSEDV